MGILSRLAKDKRAYKCPGCGKCFFGDPHCESEDRLFGYCEECFRIIIALTRKSIVEDLREIYRR